MDKLGLSEMDICTKYITPVIINAGRDIHIQIREEISFTSGRIFVKGKLCDELEKQIEESKTNTEKLLQAVLQEAFKNKF